MITAYIDFHTTPPTILVYADGRLITIVKKKIEEIWVLGIGWAILLENPYCQSFDCIYADAIRRK